jgi:hypothetical protein
MKFKIYVFIITIFYFYLIWDDLSIAEIVDPYELEWITFCKTWMRYVNQYPDALSAGCCDYNHPSNDILKEEYLGDPMLICDA